MVALFCGATSIRDVIALPEGTERPEPDGQGPNPVTAKQLKELHSQTVILEEGGAQPNATPDRHRTGDSNKAP